MAKHLIRPWDSPLMRFLFKQYVTRTRQKKFLLDKFAVYAYRIYNHTEFIFIHLLITCISIWWILSSYLHGVYSTWYWFKWGQKNRKKKWNKIICLERINTVGCTHWVHLVCYINTLNYIILDYIVWCVWYIVLEASIV